MSFVCNFWKSIARLLPWALAFGMVCDGVRADPLVQRKAKYLYEIASHVHWPRVESLRFCIIGADSVVEALEKSVAGKKLDGRAITVSRVANSGNLKNCHLAYFSNQLGDEALRQGLDNVGNGTLTVSDAKSFASQGGMIELVAQSANVRFHISQTAAKKANVKIDSDLLKIAIKIN